MKYNVTFLEDTHQYYVDGKEVPSVSKILLENGLINTAFFTEEGRKRGSAIHLQIKNQERGALCMLKPELHPYMVAWTNFKKECAWKSNPEFLERPMGCTLYGGTCDNIGTFEGKEAVLDIKSGTVSAATGLQLSAYEKLYGIYIEDPSKILLRFSLQLTDTAHYILKEWRDRGDRYIFDSAVALFWWRKNNKLG